MSSVPGDNYSANSGTDYGAMMGGFLQSVGDNVIDYGFDFLRAETIERNNETKQPVIVGQPAPVTAPDRLHPSTFDGNLPGTVQVFGFTLHKTSLIVAGVAVGGIVLYKLFK